MAFFGAFFITRSWLDSTLLATVPLLFGLCGIWPWFAYKASALLFLIGCIVFVAPEDLRLGINRTALLLFPDTTQSFQREAAAAPAAVSPENAASSR